MYICILDSGFFAGVFAAPAYAFHREHVPPAAELLRSTVRGKGGRDGNSHTQGASERRSIVCALEKDMLHGILK